MPTVGDLRYHRAIAQWTRFDAVTHHYMRNHPAVILRVVFSLDPGPRFQQLKQLLSSPAELLLHMPACFSSRLCNKIWSCVESTRTLSAA